MTMRRSRIDLATPTETKIREALAAVENLPADPRQTAASQALTLALDKVGEMADEQLTEALGDQASAPIVCAKTGSVCDGAAR